MLKRPEFSLILPCYNEGHTFQSSIIRIVRTLENLNKTWEVIFIEDKSTDETYSTVQRLLKKYKNTSVVFHKKNLGRGAYLCIPKPMFAFYFWKKR